MSTKDLFSQQSKAYAAFRPTYPDDLYDFIFQHLHHRETAWDCATGNGQVARRLCREFKNVFATDISAQQIAEGYQAENIHYAISAAEKTSFADDSFDLITVAQALHWIDTNQFFPEAVRTAKTGALLAIWGYSLMKVNNEIDRHFLRFYHDVVGPYWDKARKLVEEEYRSVDFPFDKISSPKFSIDVEWTRQQFAGYVSSWSATAKFIKEKQYDPVPEFIATLDDVWKEDAVKHVSFPLFLLLGRIK